MYIKKQDVKVKGTMTDRTEKVLSEIIVKDGSLDLTQST